MSNALLLRYASAYSLIAILICGTIYRILRSRLNLSRQGRLRFLALLVVITAVMIAAPLHYRITQNNPADPFTYLLQFLQYFFMGWVGVVLITLLAAEIINAVVRLARLHFKAEKRSFLTEGVTQSILAVTTLSTIGGLIQAKMGPKITHVTIQLKTLPPSFDGLTIAQISDVHIGPLIHEGALNSVVDQVMSLNPDLIFITGDLVDGTVEQLSQHVAPLSRLKAKEGIYFCTGNHEYYSGVEEWVAHIESMGIHVFKNTNTILTRPSTDGSDSHLMIAGVYDWHGGRYSAEHATNPFKAVKTNLPVDCKILLAHNPYSIDGATAAGVHFQVSGHTHAGQFYPFTFIARIYLKHFEGHYHINDITQLYVNRGTGFWGPPNRLGIPGEVTHFTLKRSV